jgi:hypothetical protein
LSLIFGVTGAVITKGYTSVMQNRGAIAGGMKKLIQGDSNKTAKLSGKTQQTLPQSKKQN